MWIIGSVLFIMVAVTEFISGSVENGATHLALGAIYMHIFFMESKNV